MSASMSFHPEPNTYVTCHGYGNERTPILSLWSPSASLMISENDALPLADLLAFARELAAETAAYLAALELYAASQSDKEA
ncbi:hypothetical protein GCM10010430_30390 [Kitasatospora cystarginea]|uniref:Uncharacterized protein n=1 Tax=Kitasatospora cystarginea TaxID=58350 RepID=A0ABN3E145_9ACTN